MNENIKVNNKHKKMAIFKSLMAVEIHPSNTKSLEERQEELQKLEKEGKLRIYHPTREDA